MTGLDRDPPGEASSERFELFRRLAYAAVVELADEVRVVAATPDLLAVAGLDGKQGAVVFLLDPLSPTAPAAAARPPPDRDAALADRLRHLLLRFPAVQTTVLCVGAETRGKALLESAKPGRTAKRLFLGGFEANGEAWGDAFGGPLAVGLDRVLDGRALQWAVFEERLRRSDERAEEQTSFAQRLLSRTPWVTYTLIAANAMMFLVQVAVGGEAPNAALLIRLGGVTPWLLERGEWWRLISGAFLHGGLLHLGFNMVVLYVLGRFVERIFGSERFLILYTACAIGGGLASVAFMNAAVSVGASGALWGLLATDGVLAFTPGMLPKNLVPAARRAAMANLGLNFLASFAPHIDWAAHFGGGAIGAALVYGVFARGMPRGAAAVRPTEAAPIGLRALAFGCALLLLTGVIFGPTLGGAFLG